MAHRLPVFLQSSEIPATAWYHGRVADLLSGTADILLIETGKMLG
jgi:hypothetical protein